MKNYKILLFVLLSFLSYNLSAQKNIKIKPVNKLKLEIPEPSDIALSFAGDSFFIVSDKGKLFETDLNGKIIRKGDTYFGLDCEGVFADKNYVYVVEEFSRRISVLSVKDLSLVKAVSIPYHGARNKSYEAITYNLTKNKFLLFTEKDPTLLLELDDNLNKVSEINISALARDISGATYYDGFVWLLSDEDQKVIKLDANNYKVLGEWKIPVLNPEGIAFTKEGKLVIVSDVMQMMFHFNEINK